MDFPLPETGGGEVLAPLHASVFSFEKGKGFMAWSRLS